MITCALCKMMNYQTAPDDGYFHFGGMLVSGPFHPMCRCQIMYLPGAPFEESPAPPVIEVPPMPPDVFYALVLDPQGKWFPPITAQEADKYREEMVKRLQSLVNAAAKAAAATYKKRAQPPGHIAGTPILGTLASPLSPAQTLTQGLKHANHQ